MLEGEKRKEGGTTVNIGIVYSKLGYYDKALECYTKALLLFDEIGELSYKGNVTYSIGKIYSVFNDITKALYYYKSSLRIHQETGDKYGAAIVTSAIGISYQKLNLYDEALEYYNLALAAFQEQGAKSHVANVIGNIGAMYSEIGLYDKALEFLYQALSIHKELNETYSLAHVTGNIGIIYSRIDYEFYDAGKAESHLLNAMTISEGLGLKELLVMQYKSLADFYEHEKRWEDAYIHFKKLIEVKNELNIEEVKKQESIREERKAIEIAKAAADAKHQATEELLHNVLPPSIAYRMLEGEKLIAEKLPSVSVLFADIVGFTKLSQRISPEELVEGLDRIFSVFDSLAEKHGLEKIKTIGDAYMVVSGAPEPRADHAEAMAQFALEMVEAMKEFTSKSTGEAIQLRIGIHSGEVVAGVIGKKKFAYDMWGDAVNTASRMESHGEPGKIHVSEDFARNLTPTLSPREGFSEFESSLSSSFPFGEGRDGVLVERGEMHIKGKGLMKTYYLQKANP